MFPIHNKWKSQGTKTNEESRIRVLLLKVYFREE